MFGKRCLFFSKELNIIPDFQLVINEEAPLVDSSKCSLFSKDIKNGVKSAVTFISDFEGRAVQTAKKQKCDVAVCGHIHQTELREDYMNSGDWCENCTALSEDLDGKWTILNFHL